MQKVVITGALAALFLAATLGSAAAQERERARQDGPRPGAGPRFAAMDTDGDGQITKKEFMQASRERAKEMFARLDADGDGVITEEEIRAAGQAFREGRPRPPQGEGEAPEDRPERRRRQRPTPEE